MKTARFAGRVTQQMKTSRSNEWGGTDRNYPRATVRTAIEDTAYKVMVFDYRMLLLWQAEIDTFAPTTVQSALVAAARSFAAEVA